jgi:ABC-type lipoprotein export system ATPase subunit
VNADYHTLNEVSYRKWNFVPSFLAFIKKAALFVFLLTSVKAFDIFFEFLSHFGIKRSEFHKPFQLRVCRRKHASVARVLLKKPQFIFKYKSTSNVDLENNY